MIYRHIMLKIYTYPLFRLLQQINEKRNENKPHIMVIGTGYAGKTFVRCIDHKKFTVSTISPVSQLICQPLYIDYLKGGQFKRNWKNNADSINSSVDNVDISNKTINYKTNGIVTSSKYDILVLALGSVVNTFGIKGIENCLFYKSEDDVEKIKQFMTGGKIHSKSNIAILGAGILGVELGSNMKNMIHSVTLFEMANTVIPIKGYESCHKPITDHLEQQGVILELNKRVSHIETNSDKTIVVLNDGTKYSYDYVIYTCGVKPHSIMKDSVKFKKVNDKLQVVDNDNNIVDSVYAIGDCNGLQPMSAQNAKSQGLYLAMLLNNDTAKDYEFDSMGTVINLHNKVYIKSKWYEGFAPSFLHNFINYFT
jgi:NADH dehydrogenase FAD-containing subunit